MTFQHQRTIVVAVNDLMFGSRIRAAGDQAGARVVFVRSAAALAEAGPGADLILLDLDTRWLDAPVAIAGLKEASAVPVVAFGSHVDGEALKAARDAGADRVLARSAFVRVLPELMAGG
ncbi:MAG TPA: hypothetical protein VK911_08285 [Vicinamibacterales bacterium]|nr:hypothetical protein [Vicinamibacterales bacterium]